MNITIISSSTRTGRTSHRLALALKKQIDKTAHQASIVDLAEHTLPAFIERYKLLEEKDKTENMAYISQKLKDSQALIFLTPEYNGSISSSMKNFIDTFGADEYGGKPVGVATASTGVLGGIRAAYHLQQIILSIQAYPQGQMLTVGEVTKQLDDSGEIINPSFDAKIDRFVTNFLQFSGRFVS